MQFNQKLCSKYYRLLQQKQLQLSLAVKAMFPKASSSTMA